MRRDVLASLSLATLWFIGVWSDLLPFLYLSDRFPIGALPCWNDFVAVLVNVAGLAALFTAAARVARRGPEWLRRAAGWALLASLAVPANALRSPRLAPRYGPRRHLGALRAVQASALRLAADPTVSFAVLHLPVPHAPTIYDRDRGEYRLSGARGDGYLHNLALADRSLGEIRGAVGDAGLASRTTLIVFGDHGRRDPPGSHQIAEPRVPFIVHVPGSGRGTRLDTPVEVLRVHDLTLEMLAGRVTTLEAVGGWLSR